MMAGCQVGQEAHLCWPPIIVYQL